MPASYMVSCLENDNTSAKLTNIRAKRQIVAQILQIRCVYLGIHPFTIIGPGRPVKQTICNVAFKLNSGICSKGWPIGHEKATSWWFYFDPIRGWCWTFESWDKRLRGIGRMEVGTVRSVLLEYCCVLLEYCCGDCLIPCTFTGVVERKEQLETSGIRCCKGIGKLLIIERPSRGYVERKSIDIGRLSLYDIRWSGSLSEVFSVVNL